MKKTEDINKYLGVKMIELVTFASASHCYCSLQIK